MTLEGLIISTVGLGEYKWEEDLYGYYVSLVLCPYVHFLLQSLYDFRIVNFANW